MFKIVVLLKQTFDTEEKIHIVNGAVNEEGAKFIINPYDEYALEEALRIKEQHDAEIIVISVGPERSTHALRSALAVGADQAILIADHTNLSHSSSIAHLLAATIRPMKVDLILAGLFAVDSGSGSVALQVAELLQLPHASAAIKIQLGHAKELHIEESPWDGNLARIERDVEGDTETVLLPLPALITAQQGLNDPRYPSLPGIMKAKKKPLTELFSSDLLLSDALERIAASATSCDQVLSPNARPPGQFITGTAQEQASSLLEQLLERSIIQKGGDS
ncbi:MAG: electron transfer flavoprotein subunit beta/FixA family protein [Candidatus Pristimantibacillus lignocellulolyticus]|uniref:Electron transfer flavoprotein subunit beta n=1 Tax=Candidatus Pristimantibacillus lignocellulolyticus TaxID=2994561 RepID=A0A9J6ZJU1_9BACL|nr:MAG: electron transfer flavoprotein subunit beta/FixA family protein [Candidatus Pristimantibacillus lignocellulolyticus]